ncbi:MAG: hypothetical protein QOC65_584 [Sphingomonadales bacterium]|nr:hypothetical protein [Sphingomonadales bacterium]
MEHPEALYDRIERAVAADVSGETRAVLGDILQNLRELQKLISARILSLFVVVLATELVFASRIESVSVFGFAVRDLSILQRLAPVLFAYFYFLLETLLCNRRILEAAYGIGFRQAYPTLSAAGVERLVTPPEPIKLYSVIRNHVSGAKQRWIQSAGISAVLMLVLIPPAYLLWTIARCLMLFGPLDPLTVLSCVISLVLLGQAILLIPATVGAVGGPDRR